MPRPTDGSPADELPLNADDEGLVAYLDGELDHQQRAEMEDRLVNDQRLRNRLTHLQSAWDMLDAFPMASSRPSLVESTLELAIAEVSQVMPTKTSSGRHWNNRRWNNPWILSFVMGLLAIAIAMAVAAYQSSQAYQRQWADLTIVENLDAYQHGSDLEQMRWLAANHKWTQMVSTVRELQMARSFDETELRKVPLLQREASLQEMPPEHRQRLQSRWDRFNRLSPKNQSAIRATADAVSDQPDTDVLLKTMQSYAVWRERLARDRVDRIESEDIKVSREAIDEAIDHSKSVIAKQSGAMLEIDTVEVVYLALQEFLGVRMQSRPSSLRLPAGFSGPFADVKTRQWFMIRQIFGRRDSRRSSQTPFLDLGEPLTDSELAMIESIIPESALDTLEMVSSGDPLLKSLTLQIWVEEVIRRKTPWRNEGSVLERYQTLSQAQREIIDLLPPRRMLEELTSDQPPGL